MPVLEQASIEKAIILPGIYYLVLVDLCGSTEYAVEHGNLKLKSRIQAFTNSVEIALSRTKPDNYGTIATKAGDALLLLFNHFPDVVRWWMELEGAAGESATTPQLVYRCCVHVGEYYHSKGETTCLAVNQLFKMEARKSVKGGSMVLTDLAFSLAQSSLAKNQISFEAEEAISLPGYAHPVKLHRLASKNDIAFLIQTTDPTCNDFRRQ